MPSRSTELTVHPLPPIIGSTRFSALVVEPSLAESLFITSTLTSGLFDVFVADDFHHARALLETRQPSVLVTEIRLGDYNGLQLVLMARAAKPPIAAVVVSSRDDSVLQGEAERMSATFLLKPVPRHDLLAAVYRTTLRIPRDTLPEPIRPPYERRRDDRRMRGEDARPERRLTERRRDLTAALQGLPPGW